MHYFFRYGHTVWDVAELEKIFIKQEYFLWTLKARSCKTEQEKQEKKNMISYFLFRLLTLLLQIMWKSSSRKKIQRRFEQKMIFKAKGLNIDSKLNQ